MRTDSRCPTLALVSIILALVACTKEPASTTSADSIPPPANEYVAMGSSFAAGPGLGPLKEGTPQRCTRAIDNYPSLLAGKLGLKLDDQSCSGAQTSHILGPWQELPAQIDAVTDTTRLVTITIGGNDLNYVGGLISASCSDTGEMSIAGRTFPCPPGRRASEADFGQVESNMRAIVQQVRQRAPHATIVFVQYVELLPDTLCEQTPLTEEYAGYARSIASRLYTITATVADATGVLLFPANELSREHTPCDAEPWAIGLPPDAGERAIAPWHLNARGMQAVADGLADMLRDRLT